MVSTTLVFSSLLAIRLACANLSLVTDCDEVFNYWEPLHYLTHGFGLETWEYSGEYAIRSWAYIWLHGLVIKAAQLLGITPKWMLFYCLRYVFAISSALAETTLFSSISKNISKRVAVWYLIFTAFSTGMYHASTAFLPSSFAMTMFTFAFASFLNVKSNKNASSSARHVVKGLTFMAFAGFLGWPFSLFISEPLVAQYALQTAKTKRYKNFVKTVLVVTVICLLVLLTIVLIDSACYKKLAVVPFNIVNYNILSASEDSGPEIFGTEPWTYYFQNLLLNFNIVFVLSLMSFIAPLAGITTVPAFDLLSFISTFYIWLGVLILQPHKEERFMFVSYASLCFNAALSFETLLSIGSRLFKYASLRPLYARVSLGTPVIAVFILLSISRSLALYNYYGTTMLLYQHMPSDATGNLCIGREWYRYPSSYFLNDGQRLKFIKSSFDGLLPGEFYEDDEDFNQPWWNRSGTWKIPSGMNNRNEEDPEKCVFLDECDYAVDSSAEVNAPLEVLFTSHPDWQKKVCISFLNGGKSTGIGRILYLPEYLNKLTNTHLVWDDYCIMKKVD